jgi:hypothetical protein
MPPAEHRNEAHHKVDINAKPSCILPTERYRVASNMTYAASAARQLQPCNEKWNARV